MILTYKIWYVWPTQKLNLSRKITKVTFYELVDMERKLCLKFVSFGEKFGSVYTRLEFTRFLF
jgi:hypothetical protein